MGTSANSKNRCFANTQPIDSGPVSSFQTQHVEHVCMQKKHAGLASRTWTTREKVIESRHWKDAVPWPASQRRDRRNHVVYRG